MSLSVEDRQLSEILDQFLRDREAGLRPDPESYIARYPQLGEKLRELLPGLEAMEALADSVRDSEQESQQALPQFADFEILGELGRGGMGIVYRARQVSLKRMVALKVLPLAAVFDEKNLHRFRNEANATARLNHDHIINVHAIDCEKGVHYYSMQLIEGRTLAELIESLRSNELNLRRPTVLRGRQESPSGKTTETGIQKFEAVDGGPAQTTVSSEDSTCASTAESNRSSGISIYDSHHELGYIRSVARLGANVADALFHAHEMGIVHRDIKPSNLLIDHRGKVCITDFGLARMQSDVNLTRTGDIMGTFRYMSPEQAIGQQDLVDHRTDIYSLGATLYELLTLEPVVSADGKREAQKILFDDRITPISKLNRSVPIDLETVVMKAVSAQRENRYASAAELADDLNRFLDDKPIRARRPTAIQHLQKWLRRNRWFAVTAGVFLLMLLAGSIISSILIYQRSEKLRLSESQLTRKNSELQSALERANSAETKVERLPGVFEELGIQYFQRDQFEDALKMFEAALVLDSQAVQSIFYCGRSHGMLDQHEVAESLLQKAIEFDQPAWTAAARFHLAWLRYRQNRFDDSLRLLRHAQQTGLPVEERNRARQFELMLCLLTKQPLNSLQKRQPIPDRTRKQPDGDELCGRTLRLLLNGKPESARIEFGKALRWFTFRIGTRGRFQDDFSRELISRCSAGLGWPFDPGNQDHWKHLRNFRMESTAMANASSVNGGDSRAGVQQGMNSHSWGRLWTPFFPRSANDQWTGGVQLFWKGKIGDRLSIFVNDPKRSKPGIGGLNFAAGEYRMSAYLTRANDFAIVQFWLNGDKIGQPIDLYTPAESRGEALAAQHGEFEFGMVRLSEGINEFQIEIVSRNPNSSASSFGLDFIDLWPHDFIPGETGK